MNFSIGCIVEVVIDGEFILKTAATAAHDTDTEKASFSRHIFLDDSFDFVGGGFSNVDVHILNIEVKILFFFR